MYVANEGTERRKLWKELAQNSRYVNGKPWCIASDMNVILQPNEHSCRVSYMTADMIEFQDCLNKVEVEDICRSGLHFTWTKNLHKAKVEDMTRVLKKLDRVMTNEEFLLKYPQVNAKFLPYIISDHTPSILSIPTNVKKKVKPFRFSKFLTRKQEFIPIVKEKWSPEV